jgi:heme-degrading monooxygenase HmoA
VVLCLVDSGRPLRQERIIMSREGLQSVVLASDYQVNDLERMWSLIEQRRSHLASIGAHHIVVYSSIWEAGRVLVTVGLHYQRSVREVLRSPVIFEWFDIAGVNDIPAIFAGEVVEKVDLGEPGTADAVPGLIVGVVASVDDVSDLLAEIHGALDRFKQSGIRKIWVYRAFDDGQEVLILQEVDNEDSVREWIAHPDRTAEWMSGAGLGAYPSVFVGRLAHIMSIDEMR